MRALPRRANGLTAVIACLLCACATSQLKRAPSAPDVAWKPASNDPHDFSLPAVGSERARRRWRSESRRRNTCRSSPPGPSPAITITGFRSRARASWRLHPDLCSPERQLHYRPALKPQGMLALIHLTFSPSLRSGGRSSISVAGPEWMPRSMRRTRGTRRSPPSISKSSST